MPNRRTLLRILAVLIGLRALTDVFKPLGAGSGLVFFGKMQSGTANLILAPLVGVGDRGQQREGPLASVESGLSSSPPRS